MKLSEYGLCVRRLRLEQGLTLREMAKAFEVSSPYLSSIELGERTLTQKLAENTIDYFSSKINAEQLKELRIACDKSMKSVPISTLSPDEKNLVAAFARRLSEGKGVSQDVLMWIQGERSNGVKRKDPK